MEVLGRKIKKIQVEIKQAHQEIVALRQQIQDLEE